MACISDQCQLGYLSLQNIIEAMKELTDEEPSAEAVKKASTLMKTSKGKLVEPKQSKLVKKGVFQFFDLTSKSHLNSRLWLKARLMFIQFMFNQLNDAGKAKGNDNNIIRDFGDLNYYCEKCLQETSAYFDNETKGFILFISASLDLIRGSALQTCLDALKTSIVSFMSCPQLSTEGTLNYLKALILCRDISYAANVLNVNKQLNITDVLNKTFGDLFDLNDMILNNLKTFGGETIELYLDKTKSYFNNLSGDIKNIYNPLLSFLCHTKLRLGSCLLIKASLGENESAGSEAKTPTFLMHALNVLYSGIALNKVMCERTINLEIELNYKYAYCLRELYMKYQTCTLNDVVEAYNYTINLIHNSTHDLNLIRSCYLELALTFISLYEPSVSLLNTIQHVAAGAAPKSAKKVTLLARKAAEAVLIALVSSIKCSNALKEKMLLPGHKSIKEMSSIHVKNGPLFVASDLLGYFVLADRKKVYRDDVEEEVLSLAPEFESKVATKTYDEKVASLADESNKSITWIHLLNYQSKLQHINSMRNLNTLKNGKNRFKFADLYTIGFTPIIKNSNYMAARLHQLDSHMRANFRIYETECQAPTPVAEFLKVLTKKLSTTRPAPGAHTLLERVNFFSGNLSAVLSNSSIYEKESENVSEKDSKASMRQALEWNYLQHFPANYNYNNTDSIKPNESLDSLVNYLITWNWYKGLDVCDETLLKNGDMLTAIIGVKEPSGNKIHFQLLSAALVQEIYDS